MQQDNDVSQTGLETARAAPVREAADRPKAYFSVRLTLSDAAQEFEDPRLAGAAFFRADPAERPSVAHIDGNTARTMARTEVHGAHETGEPRYFKSLPDSHAPDAEFRAGFLEAMEASLTERLGKFELGKVGANIVEKLDAGLKDDLEDFAQRAPEKAAALWAERTDQSPPGPALLAAVQGRGMEADREVGQHQAALAEKPPIIATGERVNIAEDGAELRPVAVATEHGIHAGFEITLREGGTEVNWSEQIFANSWDAIGYAFDLYEGGEKGLAAAVELAAQYTRDFGVEAISAAESLAVELRAPADEPHPEAAIYAGEDAQLVVSFGSGNVETRDLAERLVADPDFRQVVAEHISDAGNTLGVGDFTAGQGLASSSPEKLLSLTALGHAGARDILAQLPDFGPLSAALAAHLVTSPVLAAYTEYQHEHSASEEKSPVIAAGGWVTTDANVEMRPVAVATERGVHTGFEANLPGGENEIIFSERTFPNSREALRHAWDFYEGTEAGLENAVKRAVELDRDPDVLDPVPTGLVLEHREQPEFPRRETAIYASEDSQLVLTLGRDDADTQDLAVRLVADPAFRKLIAEHIPDSETTIGLGQFTDGADSSGFLPDELLVVTSYGRDGVAEVLAKFPDEGPLSEALAHHLAESPVLAAYAAEERGRFDLWENPAKAISAWVEQSSAQIDRLPPERQDDLRAEMQGIANEAVAAFGLDRQLAEIDAPPRSTLYSTSIAATTLVVAGAETEFQNGSAKMLHANLSLVASLAGIDAEQLQKRLETGAANAIEEESWVKSDIAEVAKRHGFDLGSAQGRSSAAERVDRFYERAAELIQSARSIEVVHGPDPLVEALGSLAHVHASQGSASFRNETQARDFADAMQERYGASVLQDIAAGRTEALAKDVPDPTARQAMAAAVVSAAKEHPALGLSAHDIDAAERRFAAHAQAHEHARERNRDREF